MTTPCAPAVNTAGLREEVTGSVLEVFALSCESDGSGSGFLLDEHTVVTAAHVVEDAAAVAVAGPSEARTAHVRGIDEERDLAVLDLERSVPGAPLSLAGDDPRRGAEVAAVGFPGGNALRVTDGEVLATGATEHVEGTTLREMLVTDSQVDPGNSGGPVINGHGEVAGVVVAGTGGAGEALAVPASAVDRLVAGDGMHPPEPAQCDSPLGPARDVAVATPAAGEFLIEAATGRGPQSGHQPCD